jgi:3-hydroxybutyryl-CoA dehydrogenase
MTIPEIRTICYVGAGTMGCYNSLAAAVSGYRVVLYDVDEQALQQVGERHHEMAGLLVGGGYCTKEDIAAALQRVSVEARLEMATAEADLVSESVVENLDVKRDVHRQLDASCAPDTILTTNSSALPVSAIEDVVARGERFAALHTHFGSPLVDIVGGPRTDPAVIEILERYVESTKGVPLVLRKEYPGYVLNAMLGPVLGAALALVVDGLASMEEVDRAWMHNRRAPMGPFGMMDLFGLNVIFDSWEHRELDVRTERLQPKVLDLLRPYIERGDLGMKTGVGFYRYPAPAYREQGFLDAGDVPAGLIDILLVALVSNAILIAAAGVAEPAQIDRAWQVGTYLDAGPFGILSEIGEARFRQTLAREVEALRADPDKALVVEHWLGEHGARQGSRPG